MKVHLNGRLTDAAQAAVAVGDRGFTLGDGVFETIKVLGGRPLRLAAHWQRLAEGARLLRLPLPLDADALEAALAQVLAANGLDDAAVRLTVSRGPGQRGLLPPVPCTPTVLLTAGPLPPAPGPARAVIAREVRRNQHSPLARCKALSYLDNVLARLEAEERGADEALLLNTDGRLAEASIANLFVVMADGTIATPPVADGALPGVRRAELIGQVGAVERPLMPEDLDTAREAFLTNALGVRPLVAVDGRPIGGGGPGPLTRALLDGMDQDTPLARPA